MNLSRQILTRMLVKDVAQVETVQGFKQKAKIYWSGVDANIDGKNSRTTDTLNGL